MFEVCEKTVVPDDFRTIVGTLRDFSDTKRMDIVITTGGTGLGPRDVTPEATATVCDRMVPGLSEILRYETFRKTPNAVLSRGVSGMRENTLIINLPGSPKAVRECLEIILDILPHAVDMMRGSGH
jgi:molybdenum cofactor synthesis domain-containing protein